MTGRQIKRSIIKDAVITLKSYNRESYAVQVLGGPLDGENEQYSTYADALLGFERMIVKAVLEGGSRG